MTDPRPACPACHGGRCVSCGYRQAAHVGGDKCPPRPIGTRTLLPGETVEQAIARVDAAEYLAAHPYPFGGHEAPPASPEPPMYQAVRQDNGESFVYHAGAVLVPFGMPHEEAETVADLLWEAYAAGRLDPVAKPEPLAVGAGHCPRCEFLSDPTGPRSATQFRTLVASGCPGLAPAGSDGEAELLHRAADFIGGIVFTRSAYRSDETVKLYDDVRACAARLRGRRTRG